ncbi:MAG TPA: tRNA (adenine-N1)-methyltransferase [Bacillota bacterium]
MEPRDLRRQPFRPGEPVIVLDDRGRRYHITLQLGKVFQTHRIGLLPHDAVIGQPPGTRIGTDRGVVVVCLRPTLEDAVLGLKRRTQIIYPKDLGLILVRGDIFPGATVVESGIGSGAAAMVLLRFLGAGGHLISYELREEFARLASRNLEQARSWWGDSGARHTVRIGDVYDGIDERDVDTVLLDVPEPHRAAPHAAAALRPGGTLLCWLPTALQVYALVRHLQQDPRWASIETGEMLMRPWDVAENSVRPAHRMVAHTGFLISARRVVADVTARTMG